MPATPLLLRLLTAAIVLVASAACSWAQTGACCDPSGNCTLVPPLTCTGMSVYQGDDTVCVPASACRGACCSAAGSCSLTTPSGCSGASTFLGAGSVCMPAAICSPSLGACCSATGQCTLTMPAGCAGNSLFRGVGSTCMGTPCVAEFGPCCDFRGTCTLTRPAACALPSTFLAVGQACGPANPCNIPSGACCSSSGACAIKLATGSGAAACGGTAGDVYLGNDTTCNPNRCPDLTGACCQPNGSCVIRTAQGCEAIPGQTFTGVASLCAPSPCPTGACCSAAGSCSITIAGNCIDTDTYLGDGSTCAPSNPCTARLGACCPSGSTACTLTTARGCSGESPSSATFNGVGTTCAPVDVCAPQRGACCSDIGGCALTVARGCQGVFRGAGSTCAPSPCRQLTGACCSDAGFCFLTIGAACDGVNSFQGAGTICVPSPCASLQGACCSDRGACTITTQGSCFGNDTFLGAGTTCAGAPCAALRGACCSPLGVCRITVASGCTGSSTFLGAGSTCTPNPCVPTQGACCTPQGACSVTTAASCAGPASWSAGAACSPGNPCFAPVGACCIGLACTAATAAQNCTSAGGAFFFGQSCMPSPCTRPPIVISQLYTGGGEPGAIYSHDYVILFNRSASPVVMNNWSLQFGAAETQDFPTRATINATIAPNRYFLIQLGSANPAVGAPLSKPPDLNLANLFDLDTVAGRLALVADTTPLVNGCVSPLPVNIVDFVGYGPATGIGQPSCSEGFSPAGGAGAVLYAFKRKGGGCQDTDINGFDFLKVSEPDILNAGDLYGCGTTLSGACCVGETCSIATDSGDCAALGGAFAGEGTTCSPINPCLQPKGACCDALSCTFVVETACVEPAIFRFGRSCTPDPCAGACCNGGTCSVTSADACLAPSYFIAGAICEPGDCAAPDEVESGDIAYASAVDQYQDSVQQIRTSGGPPLRTGTWTRFNNLRSMRFDNHQGVRHSAQGNLLGLAFGDVAGGGTIVNLPTTSGSPSAGQSLFAFTGSSSPFGLERSRLTGLSISPSNNRIAMIGYDTGRLIVLSYNPGATTGTGTGAAVDGGAQSGNTAAILGFAVAQGTAWLDNDQVLLWAQSNIASVLKLYTVPISGAGPAISIGAPVERLTVADNKPNSGRFTALAYNPQLIPGYLFLTSSATPEAPQVSLYVVDVSGPTWTIVRTLDLADSMHAAREIAIGPDRSLYLSQFAGPGRQAADALIDRLVLDADGNGVVTAAEILALESLTTADYYLKGTANSGSINGLDIAIALGACCQGATCSLQPPGFCTGPDRAYAGDFTACSPAGCLGACCRGTICFGSLASGCTGPNTSFAGVGLTCNPAGNLTAPCCKADFNHVGGVTVQDIFDFLAAYFSGIPGADINGGGLSVQDIFTFLAAYFAGGC